MKKALLIFLFSFLCAWGAKAQLIHAKGDMSAGLGFSFVQGGFNTAARYNYLLSNSIGLKGSILYESKAFEFNKLSIVAFEADALYTFKRYGNSWFLNVGAGLFSGYEISNSTIFENYRKFSVGESLSISVDYYINHRFIVDLTVKQRIHQLSEFGQLSWYSGLGVNYKF